MSQSSFYSVNDSRLHFGLGSELSADLEIRWPNGLKESIKKVASGQLVTIKEGLGIVDKKKFGQTTSQTHAP
jgi:enediyne biosynthesis protein E4